MSTQNKHAVKVENLTKSFQIPLEAHSGIKQKLINTIKGRKGYREFTPLKNVSFEIEKGDFFGIVGRNGSGKSTLLKTLAGIYTPNNGVVHVNGTLVPFIELGVGFNPELTGRENVFLNGALLGFSHNQMENMYDDIVDFAELHDFMEERLKNYSSGMQVRLAFSIAIRADGDVLLLDEVLAVGDEAFQRKCYQYFAELKKKKKTVILVTHDMDAVQRFCNKALMIEKGEIIEQGNPAKVAQKYRGIFNQQQQETTDVRSGDGVAESDFISIHAAVEQSDDEIILNIETSRKKSMESPLVAIGIIRDTGEQVYRWASDEKIGKDIDVGSANITLTLDNIFPEAEFNVVLMVKSQDRSKNYGIFNDILKFTVPRRSDSQWDAFWKPGEKVSISTGGNESDTHNR